MFRIAIVIIVLSSCQPSSTLIKDFEYERYESIALALMDSLDIPVRPNHHLDPPIKFLLEDIPHSAQTETVPSRSLDSNIVYRYISIRVSPRIIRILKQKDTLDLHYRFAQGTIIHELVHVLQYPDTIATNTGTDSDFTNRSEFEALAVLTYYLEYKESPMSIQSMLSACKGDKKELQLLLNDLFRARYFKRRH